FNMACTTSTHSRVIRVGQMASRVARAHPLHPAHFLEYGFGAPETASAQYCDFTHCVIPGLVAGRSVATEASDPSLASFPVSLPASLPTSSLGAASADATSASGARGARDTIHSPSRRAVAGST